MSDPIFVFGSNLAGRHGKGAAKFAHDHRGAEYGVGEGRTGNAYALPTKDEHLRRRMLEDVAASVAMFLNYAREHPALRFQVTPIGCGLAGFMPYQIAPLFLTAPSNCWFADEAGKDWRPSRETGFGEDHSAIYGENYGHRSVKRSHRAEGRNYVD